MKRVVYIVLLTITFFLFGMIGYSVSVNAANTSNSQYMFYNINVNGNTSSRNKYNNSKVYVYPTSGPELRYTVQGYNNHIWNNRSGTFQLKNNVKASITNFVYEHDESKARLKYTTTQKAYVFTYGYWSPDSKYNYNVYI